MPSIIRPLGVPPVPGTIPCPDCRGTGEVPWTPRGRPVYSCGLLEMTTCRACRGTGEIDPDAED